MPHNKPKMALKSKFPQNSYLEAYNQPATTTTAGHQPNPPSNPQTTTSWRTGRVNRSRKNCFWITQLFLAAQFRTVSHFPTAPHQSTLPGPPGQVSCEKKDCWEGGGFPGG